MGGKFTASKWFFAMYFIEIMTMFALVGAAAFFKNKIVKNKSSKFNMFIMGVSAAYIAIGLLQFMINLGVAPKMDCDKEIDGKCTLKGWAGVQDHKEKLL